MWVLLARNALLMSNTNRATIIPELITLTAETVYYKHTEPNRMFALTWAGVVGGSMDGRLNHHHHWNTMIMSLYCWLTMSNCVDKCRRWPRGLDQKRHSAAMDRWW